MMDEQEQKKQQTKLIALGIVALVIVLIGVGVWVAIDKFMIGASDSAQTDFTKYMALARVNVEPSLQTEVLEGLASKRVIAAETLANFPIYTEDVENERRGDFLLKPLAVKRPYDVTWKSAAGTQVPTSADLSIDINDVVDVSEEDE
ncbi:hypothetical protein IJJ12_02255 [bacterium]|nr:hypothetical protein [bacterium]